MLDFLKLRVLIVDDEAFARDILTQMFTSLGFAHVEVCATGAEAVMQVIDDDFDLIFLDVGLGDESGLQVARSIRNIEGIRPVRIVVATASRDHDVAIVAKRVGADDFLLKPFTPVVLKDRLQRLFARNSFS